MLACVYNYYIHVAHPVLYVPTNNDRRERWFKQGGSNKVIHAAIIFIWCNVSCVSQQWKAKLRRTMIAWSLFGYMSLNPCCFHRQGEELYCQVVGEVWKQHGLRRTRSEQLILPNPPALPGVDSTLVMLEVITDIEGNTDGSLGPHGLIDPLFITL